MSINSLTSYQPLTINGLDSFNVNGNAFDPTNYVSKIDTNLQNMAGSLDFQTNTIYTNATATLGNQVPNKSYVDNAITLNTSGLQAQITANLLYTDTNFVNKTTTTAQEMHAQLIVPSLNLTAQTASKVPIIDASKNLVSSGVDAVKITYLDNVNSDIQTQLNTLGSTKADITYVDTNFLNKVTGTTQIVNSTVNFNNGVYALNVQGNTLTQNTATPNTACVFDSSKNIVSSAVTSTELGYVSGVTSNIQTQLNNKASTSYVDSQDANLQSQINTKASTTYVDTQDANLQSQINTKASTTYVDTQDANLQSQINTKASTTYVDTQDALRVPYTGATSLVNLGAQKIQSSTAPTVGNDLCNKTYVDTQDASLQSQINTKASTSYVDSQDANLQSQINTKASTTYVDTQDALRVLKTGDSMSGSLTVDATVNVGNRFLGSVDGSNNFWIGLRGSGTETQRLAMAINGNSSTGAIDRVNINYPLRMGTNVVSSSYVPVNGDDLCNKTYVDSVAGGNITPNNNTWTGDNVFTTPVFFSSDYYIQNSGINYVNTTDKNNWFKIAMLKHSSTGVFRVSYSVSGYHGCIFITCGHQFTQNPFIKVDYVSYYGAIIPIEFRLAIHSTDIYADCFLEMFLSNTAWNDTIIYVALLTKSVQSWINVNTTKSSGTTGATYTNYVVNSTNKYEINYAGLIQRWDSSGTFYNNGRGLFGFRSGSKRGIFLDNEDSYGTTPCIQGVDSGFGTSSISINPVGGDVGIGLTNPGVKLDVSGAIRASELIYPIKGFARQGVNTAVAPSDQSSGSSTMLLGRYNNNGTTPYADLIILNNGVSSTSGNVNLLAINKGGFGIRQFQGAFGSSTAMSSYSNCVMTDANSANVSFSGSVNILGNNILELGYGLTKDGNAGKIGYGIFSANMVDIVGGGTAYPRTIKMWDDVIVGNALTVNGTIYTPARIAVTNSDPGDLISKRYGSGDRYGIGQYSNGTTRVFTSDTYTASSIRFSRATNDDTSGAGAFTDLMTIDHYGNVNLLGGSTITIGTTLNNANQSFRVRTLGATLYYYPVIINVGAQWNSGNYDFCITRFDIHQDGGSTGDFHLTVEGRTNNWGQGADFLKYKYIRGNGTRTQWVANVVSDPYSPQVIVFLYGGYTYYFSGKNAYLQNGNESGVALYNSYNNVLYNPQNTINNPFDCGSHVEWDSRNNVYFRDGGVFLAQNSYGLIDPDTRSNSYGSITTYGNGKNGYTGYGLDERYCFMKSIYGAWGGIHDNSYTWLLYWDGANDKNVTVGCTVKCSTGWDRCIMYANGINTSGGYFYYNAGNSYGTISDRRIKKDFETIQIEKSIAFLKKLEPTSFCLRDAQTITRKNEKGEDEEVKETHCSCRQDGWIAQNVLEACKEAGISKSAVNNWYDYEQELNKPEDERTTLIGVSDRPILSHTVNIVKHLLDTVETLQNNISVLVEHSRAQEKRDREQDEEIKALVSLLQEERQKRLDFEALTEERFNKLASLLIPPQQS